MFCLGQGSVWGIVVVGAQYNNNPVGVDAGAVYLFVPEPATLGLLIVGGLALLKRRRAG